MRTQGHAASKPERDPKGLGRVSLLHCQMARPRAVFLLRGDLHMSRAYAMCPSLKYTAHVLGHAMLRMYCQR